MKSFIFINCGGSIDIAEFISVSSETKIYVIDCHRPFNLNNVFNQEQICVFDEEDSSFDYENLLEAFETVQFSDEEEDNVSDEEERIQKSERKQDFEKLIDDYYRSHYYGSCSSSLIYSLACQLGVASNELLWNNIVGLTHLYIYQKVDRDFYNEHLKNCGAEVSRFNLTTDEDFEDQQDENFSLESKIRFEDEYRFVLTKHWTLYNSMFYSNYVATRFTLWRERGKKKLETLLARMGYFHIIQEFLFSKANRNTNIWILTASLSLNLSWKNMQRSLASMISVIRHFLGNMDTRSNLVRAMLCTQLMRC